jgi:hypothetical protein
MKPQMRSTKRSKARRLAGSLLAAAPSAMAAKLVVPVRAFQPASLLRISSAREMCSSLVEAGESLPTSEA